MKVKELMALLDRVDPETEVVVGKLENDKFKTAFYPHSLAVLKKHETEELLCCIFYDKTVDFKKKFKKEEKNNESVC